MLHASLWQQSGDIAQRFLEHRFVRRLADGTLDRDVFRRYIAQDAFFLRDPCSFRRQIDRPGFSLMTAAPVAQRRC